MAGTDGTLQARTFAKFSIGSSLYPLVRQNTPPFLHRSALTFLDRNGLTENHQGGKTGGVTLRMRILNSRVNSGARKSFGRLAQW